MAKRQTAEEFWAELDRLGADEVRVRLANKFYSDVNERGAWAREWVLRRELTAAAESELSNVSTQREQTDIARSAKDAAWVAARAAEAANTRATIALIMAATSIAITTISIVVTIIF